MLNEAQMTNAKLPHHTARWIPYGPYGPTGMTIRGLCGFELLI